MAHITVLVADARALEEERLFAKAYDLVSDERREKVKRLRFKSDRALCLCAGLLLNRALTGDVMSPCPPLSADAHGKPFLPEADVRFNLSHSGRYALVAYGDVEVGCDVQKPVQVRNDVARRFFAVEERAFLAASPTPETFARLWTRKESVVKALGAGLFRLNGSFSVVDENGRLAETLCLEDKTYFFTDIPLPDHAAALCTLGKAEVNVEDVELAKIDENVK